MSKPQKPAKFGHTAFTSSQSTLSTSNLHNADYFTNFNDIYTVSEVQKLDWLRSQLKQRKCEYTIERPLYVFCGSWNVNAKKPPNDLANWLIPPPVPSSQSQNGPNKPNNNRNNQAEPGATNSKTNGLKTTTTTTTAEIMPDIYALGFQEIVDLKIGTGAAALGNHKQSQQASKNWQNGIMATLGAQNYTLIKAKHLVGLSLHVYVKNDLLPHVQDVKHEKVGVGFMGVGGNKGGVAIRFRIHDSSFVFINSHLAAHANKCDNRNMDFKNILERIRFPTNHTSVSSFPFQIVNSTTPYQENHSTSHYNQQQSTQPSVVTHGLKFTNHTNIHTQAHQQSHDKHDHWGDHPAAHSPNQSMSSISPPFDPPQHNSQSGSGEEKGGNGGQSGHHHLNEQNDFLTPPDQSSLSEPLNIAQHVNYPQPNSQPTINGRTYPHSQHSQPYPRPNSFLTIKDHDNCFWLGDLNYRLNVPVADIHGVYDIIEECSKQQKIDLLDYSNYSNQSTAQTCRTQPIRFSKLLALDQLLQTKAARLAFADWNEGIIDFPPTYKYLPGTTQWDPSHKRVPAWCDRIQWIGSDVSQLLYDSVQLTISDHFPVRSIFRVVSRTLHLYKKILFIQLLLKHYAAMQILATPRLMFNSNLFNLGSVFYNTPVLSEITLFNPSSKKPLYWRIISPYDAKHIVDDNDIKKLLASNHLSTVAPIIPSHYTSINHHHYTPHINSNQLSAFAGALSVGIGGSNGLPGPNYEEDLSFFQQPPSTSLHSSQFHSLTKKQQQQLQNLILHTQQPSFNPQGNKKDQQLIHHFPPDLHNHSSLALQLLTHSSSLPQTHLHSNNHSFSTSLSTQSNPSQIPIISQPHLYIHHDPFQYTSANKKTSSYSQPAQQNQPQPQPHYVTYLPQRNDPFTHLHPTWIKFPALQGKIDPGATITLPFLVQVKQHEALRLVSSKSQLSTTIFFATSFHPLNVNINPNNNGAKDPLLMPVSSHSALPPLEHPLQSNPPTQSPMQSVKQIKSTGPAAAILNNSFNNHLATSTSPSSPSHLQQSPHSHINQHHHLAPSQPGISSAQRSHNVNVALCHISGTYQYSCYGLSLALLCDTYESIRSLQVMSQLNAASGTNLIEKKNDKKTSEIEHNFLSTQHARYFSTTKPKFYSNSDSNVSQFPPQPIPKEYFQLVNAIVKGGLSNPKSYILSDFDQYINILLPISAPTRARGGGANHTASPSNISDTTSSASSSSSSSSSSSTNSTKSTLMLFSATNKDSLTDSQSNSSLSTKRLHCHTVAPRVDNLLLYSTLLSCLDEQNPIPLEDFQNTSTLWFTLLDLLFNLPEPLFPLGLIDKMTQFRTMTSNSSSRPTKSHVPQPQQQPATGTNKTHSTPTKGEKHHMISSAVLTSSTNAPPQTNPYAFLKYIPLPMKEYHQILYNHQLLSLMSSFCFYILKWLPVSHYNLFIYLLSFIKKILHMLTQVDNAKLSEFGLQRSQSTISSSPQHNSAASSSSTDSNDQVDIESLKQYIIAKFTQASCQISSLQATHLHYPFPLSIITYFLNSPDFL